jgi:hypothetical protein
MPFLSPTASVTAWPSVMPMSSTVWWGVDVQIALCVDTDVHHAVTRNLVQHVVEEGKARLEFGFAGAVEIHRDGDLRLQRVSRDRGLALSHGVLQRGNIGEPVPRKAGHYRGMCGLIHWHYGK